MGWRRICSRRCSLPRIVACCLAAGAVVLCGLRLTKGVGRAAINEMSSSSTLGTWLALQTVSCYLLNADPLIPLPRPLCIYRLGTLPEAMSLHEEWEAEFPGVGFAVGMGHGAGVREGLAGGVAMGIGVDDWKVRVSMRTGLFWPGATIAMSVCRGHPWHARRCIGVKPAHSPLRAKLQRPCFWAHSAQVN